jgi:hypothetical protein
MSRLLDKIKKQTEAPAFQIGFRRTLQEAPKPTILLIARAVIDKSGSPVKNIEGADAVLLDASGFDLTAKNLPKIVKPLGSVPWGIAIEESKDTGDTFENSGCDFVVLTPASPVNAAPKNEKTGKIMQVESSMDDGLLRALNDLPVDAVLSADSFEENGALSYHHLMILRYMAQIIKKPLLVPVPAGITKEELKALWDAGVEAVVVPVDCAKDETLKELREVAATLPPRASHKLDIFLPSASGRRTEPEPDEEEEEEE